MEKGSIRRKDSVRGRNLSSRGNQWVMLTGGKRKDCSRNTQNDTEPELAILWPVKTLSRGRGQPTQPAT